jgi:integrase
MARGYTFKDKRGRWYARVTFTDSTGKRRNLKRRARDGKDAQVILKSLRKQLEAREPKSVDWTRRIFSDLVDHYEEHYCKSAEYLDGKKVSGLRDVTRAKSVLPRFRAFFGRRPLREIGYGDLRAYYQKRMKEPTHYDRPPNVATMNREMGILRRVFNIGVREGWVERNPFTMGESLISPSSERQRERILSVEEETRLLESCPHPLLRALYICLLDTGARLSEFLQHLRWRSVSFETRTVVLESMTTKTLKGRQVSMTARMCRELKALWDESSKSPDARVFETTVRVARREFMLACRRAGVPYGSPDGITIHSLRHTAATRLVRGQMPLHLVGKILGHSQPQTSYKYLSLTKEATEQAALILETYQDTAEQAETSAVIEVDSIN